MNVESFSHSSAAGAEDELADPCAASAVAIASAVRAGRADPEDVVRAHLERIARRDPDLNAFQIVRGTRALEEARALRGRPDLATLPLAGVPVAIKDNVDVAGEPTRLGSAATSARPATHDDELVRRLRAAGAIVIGKTRMPELAVWPFTESDAYGDTRNPWDPTRGAGGSSGGSAVAVAAGMATLALGSDGGGSIRVPASCCGVVGLKPGPGCVPVGGGLAEHWFGLTEFGPLARDAADAALMLDVLRGAPNAASGIGAPEIDALTPLRIAVSVEHPVPGGRVDAEVRQAVHALAALLSSAGHRVRWVDPPYRADFIMRFARRWLPGIAADARGLPPTQLEPRTRDMARMGRFIVRRGWQRSASAEPYRDQVRRWFVDHDVLITPTLAEPAVPVGAWRGKGWIATTLGIGTWLFTSPWNLAQCAAASLPVARSSRGLPIGAQLVALPGNERTLLSLMAQVEHLQTGTAVGGGECHTA
jgi:amidase